MTTPDVVIRPYERADRARVRHICFQTGYLGDPVDWQWRDAESFADMFSGYYTDAEPESAFVVEIDGQVEGYLLGAVDARKPWSIGKVARRHMIRRGIAFRPGTAPVIWRTFSDGFRDLAAKRVTIQDLEFHDPKYPAHLHIDLLPAARGLGAGRRLINSWFDRLRSLDVPGCYLQTFAENHRAVPFFHAVGFTDAGPPILTPGPRSPDGERLHTLAMVHSLA